MIQIDNALVSLEVMNEHFACDLSACKGACCVLGDAGAPLNAEEVTILEDIYPAVEPYLRPEGKMAIQEQGTSTTDSFDGEKVTPLIDGKECAYVTFSDQGVALCGIEQAYRDGKVDWKKPISCHLYPIRIQKYRDFEAVNYDRWHICKPACDCGAKQKIKVYQFAKEALTRKFGADWYAQLDETFKAYQSTLDKDK